MPRARRSSRSRKTPRSKWSRKTNRSKTTRRKSRRKPSSLSPKQQAMYNHLMAGGTIDDSEE